MPGSAREAALETRQEMLCMECKAILAHVDRHKLLAGGVEEFVEASGCAWAARGCVVGAGRYDELLEAQCSKAPRLRTLECW